MKKFPKKLKYQKERLDFGKKPIPKSLLKGMTRDEYTREWEDNCLLGVIYCLHSGKPMTYKHIGRQIGWGWRTVKNKFNHVIKKSILRTALKEKKLKIYDRGLKNAVFWSIDNPAYLNLSYNELVSAVTGSFYKTNPGQPNKCEQLLLDIALEIQPDLWKFNGKRIPENSVDGLFPDLINRTHMLTIDHFGERFHDRDVGEEEKRIKRLESQGFKCLIIWENELKDKNKCKKKIKEFIENALQDIQRMVV
jgi:hypothetical protein